MFPIQDSHATYRFPFFTVVLIVVNVLVFLLELAVFETDAFIQEYALIPSKVDVENYFSWMPFITSQFLHA